MGRTTRLRQPRGYDDRWLQERGAFLRRYPACLGCKALGLSITADVVDHIIPHLGDKTLFWDVGNWQPACYWHHNMVKAALENLWAARKIVTDGLRLDSEDAKAITRANQLRREKPWVGTDGWPVKPGS